MKVLEAAYRASDHTSLIVSNSLIMNQEQESIVDQAEQYVKTSTELYTLKFTEKASVVISSVFSRLTIALFGFLVLFMITMGLSYWLGEVLGHTSLGFLIIGGVIGIVTLILYLKRDSLIKKPIQDSIITQMLK